MKETFRPAHVGDIGPSGAPLSREVESIIDEASERTGVGKYTDRQAFDGLVDSLYTWGFRTEEVDAFARQYIQAEQAGDVDAQAIALKGLVALSDACHRERLGDAVVDRLAEPNPMPNVGARVEGKGPFSRYKYRVEREDYPLLHAWKQEVDQLAEEVRSLLRGESGDTARQERVRDIVGKDADDSIIIRFALAVFLHRKRTSWRQYLTPLRGALVAVFGGFRSIRDFGKRLDFCADMALVGQVMADELGFFSQIRNAPLHPDVPIRVGFHQYLVFQDGVVIDLDADPRVSGFFRNIEIYRATLDEHADDLFFC